MLKVTTENSTSPILTNSDKEAAHLPRIEPGLPTGRQARLNSSRKDWHR
jgi:hypothetical protein